MRQIPFRARARTVDHLGREQIADCPTAVSELWKNAYDAYARSVALEVHAGPVPLAVVHDDGHGMTEQEFVQRWLMLGTDSKAGDAETPAEDRLGLPQRPRQGQKGIGRLSVAYLGPTVLVLSKRASHGFLAALVDWRLFQNPYLALDDVQIPVETFERKEDLHDVVSRLFDGLVENVWGGTDAPRAKRLEEAWERLGAQEREEGGTTTAEEVSAVLLDAVVGSKHLARWPAWAGIADHGTALVVLDVTPELGVWVRPGVSDEDPEVETSKRKLQLTLRGFTDPFREEPPRGLVGTQEPPPSFKYSATAFPDDEEVSIVSSDEAFDLRDLRQLEHVVEGSFDEAGVFSGTVRAWGKDLGAVTVVPKRPPPPPGRSFVGPFEICFGTFEQEPDASTHTADVITLLKDRAERFSGLCVYRDGIRVQPYGRPEADFFGMEERRQKHLGREFWAHRRTFGRVAIHGGKNRNLRDKAGREGLIDNRAAREFRLLVVDLLMTLARRYFGSDANLRKEEMEAAKRKRLEERSRAEAEKARKRRVWEFRALVKQNRPSLTQCTQKAEALRARIDGLTGAPSSELAAAARTLGALRDSVSRLALPAKPKTIGPRSEVHYREYRDDLMGLEGLLDEIAQKWSDLNVSAAASGHVDVMQSAVDAAVGFLKDGVEEWNAEIQQLLSLESSRWRERAKTDVATFREIATTMGNDVRAGRRPLHQALNQLEQERVRAQSEASDTYGGYARAMATLAAGIDLDAAFGSASDEAGRLAESLDQWQRLAQLGITVEIINHELNDSAAQVVRNFAKLPDEVRHLEAFRKAEAGFNALVERLRFLAPLRVSGSTLRQVVTGSDIERHVREFLGSNAEKRNVAIQVTDAFRSVVVEDYPHRILPVFVNLVNNALYWVGFVDERRVLLDKRDDLVFIADSGPGVDPDDVPDLFRLFFTRKVNGHGVGLYLSRVNLEQGGHSIRYADPGEGLLPGANFIIEFQGGGS